MMSLRTLWRKVKKEKLFLYSSTTLHNVQYDIDSYSMNFDDGYYSSDPDNASRSFSARFAILDSKVHFDKRSEIVKMMMVKVV